MIKIRFKNKVLTIKKFKERTGIGQALGLMFSRQNTAIAQLFRFDKPVKMSIHSLFCPKFLAIWLKNNKIIDYQLITTLRFSVSPKSEFDTLIEIPVNKTYQNIIRAFG